MIRAGLLMAVVGYAGACCFACTGGPESHGGSPGSGNAAAACEGRGQTFEAGMSLAADGGQLMVQLSSAEPAPPVHGDNRWLVSLSDAAGNPVEGASIVSTPYMVDHGHAAPTTLSAELGAGLYELAPIALTMNGFWEITLKIVGFDAEPSLVTFSFCVSDP